MIKLTNQTIQDFLSRYWVEKLQAAGIPMEDASYFIISRISPIGVTEFIITLKI